jgi:Ni/Fe-hydrogenase subunit HybB-like protein
VAGFVPDSFDRVVDYWPNWNEALVAAGVLSVGVFVLTVLYKVAISVKEEAIFDKYGQRQVTDGKEA